MELAIYAHPWDLRALQQGGGLRRLGDLGFGEVALAVSYHAGRWFTPWQPDSMVRFLEDGTVHYRPQADYGRLAPLASSEVRDGEPSPLEWLCEHAPAAGLRARAWAVLTHNTRLGELHPDCCVENAFGDRYSYSLCPAQPAVQRYAAAMVEDLRRHPGLSAIELEAVAPLGHRHNSHHDKSSWAPETFADALLSTCWCDACRRGLAAMEFEGAAVGAARVATLRAAFAAALRRRYTDGDCMGPAEPKLDRQGLLDRLRAEFGADVAGIPANRMLGILQLLVPLQSKTPGAARLCAQTNYDGLRDGAALPLAMVAGSVEEAALTVYGQDPRAVAAALPHLLAARGEALTPPLPRAQWPALRLCFHPKAPQFTGDDDLRALRALCTEHGVGAISIYHLGLLPWRTIERVAKVMAS
ncbi:MAG: hypothetical protein AB7O97_12720 [Planctomycetota bacterium]